MSLFFVSMPSYLYISRLLKRHLKSAVWWTVPPFKVTTLWWGWVRMPLNGAVLQDWRSSCGRAGAMKTFLEVVYFVGMGRLWKPKPRPYFPSLLSEEVCSRGKIWPETLSIRLLFPQSYNVQIVHILKVRICLVLAFVQTFSCETELLGWFYFILYCMHVKWLLIPVIMFELYSIHDIFASKPHN